jgi:hypothetical protein
LLDIVVVVEMVCPVTVTVKSLVLLDPLTWFPDWRSLESHTKATTLREYACGWLSVRFSEADSVPLPPAPTAGIMAQTASFAYGVPARD